MNGIRLYEVLETIYEATVVTHMKHGKDVTREYRGHILVEFNFNY